MASGLKLYWAFGEIDVPMVRMSGAVSPMTRPAVRTTAVMMPGKPVADAVFADLAPRVEALRAAGRNPGLGTILVGYLGQTLGWGWGTSATPAAVIDAWLHSTSHRRIVLSSRYRRVGIGIVRGTPVAGTPAGLTYTADFGSGRATRRPG